MQPSNIHQIFHTNHPGLDIVGNQTNYGYGTPLCAPENCLVIHVRQGDKAPSGHAQVPGSLEYGYGIRLKGLETGHEYLYWHVLPMLPVWGGDTVKRGQIVAYMGNAGTVYSSWFKDGQVPYEKRTKAPHPGTHLHIEMFKDGKQIDPRPHINWNWEPQYTLSDFIGAMMVVLKKMLRAVK